MRLIYVCTLIRIAVSRPETWMECVCSYAHMHAACVQVYRSGQEKSFPPHPWCGFNYQPYCRRSRAELIWSMFPQHLWPLWRACIPLHSCFDLAVYILYTRTPRSFIEEFSFVLWEIDWDGFLGEMASSRDSSAKSFLRKAGKYAGRAHEKVSQLQRIWTTCSRYIGPPPPGSHGAHTLAQLAVEGSVYMLVGRQWSLLYVYVSLTEGEGRVVDGVVQLIGPPYDMYLSCTRALSTLCDLTLCVRRCCRRWGRWMTPRMSPSSDTWRTSTRNM